MLQETIHLPEWIGSLVGITIGLGVLTLGAGYLVGQFRQGANKGLQEAVLGYKEELSLCSQSRDRLELEVREYRSQVAKLEGIVEQLREENARLTNLVMGETVPPAMFKAMEAVAREGVEQITGEIAAVARSLTASVTRIEEALRKREEGRG